MPLYRLTGLRSDCIRGLPDFCDILAKARACYLLVVRSRPDTHLTRLALSEVENNRKGELNRLWLRPAEALLARAGIDASRGLLRGPWTADGT